MVSIIWNRKALDDLKSIYNYISRDSSTYGKFMVQKIKTSVRKLEKFQKIGREVPEIGFENIRELIVQPYRLIYEINSNQIKILAILHSAQKLDF